MTLRWTSFVTYHRVYNQKINTTGATNGAGTAYPSGAPEFTPDFQWGSCYSIFSFICMFCRSLFVLLYFFFWPLCCLFFFDIWILITPLVSLSSSLIAVESEFLSTKLTCSLASVSCKTRGTQLHYILRGQLCIL